MKDADFRESVLSIYQAVAEPSHWASVLDQITDRLNARGCIVFEWQTIGTERRLLAPLISSNYDPALVQEYIAKYTSWESNDQDLFERQSLSFDGIELVYERDLFDNDGDYLDQPHVKEMLQYGIRHRFGGLLDKDNTYRARFAIQTGETRGPLTLADQEVLGTLLPHVAKAMDLAGPLGAKAIQQQALLSIIEQLSVGVCLLDANGRVVLGNSEFNRQRDEYHAFWTDSHGRLMLHEKADQAQYARLLDDVLNHGAFGARPRKEAVHINSVERAAAICMEIVPIHRLAELSDGSFSGALLLCRDTTQPITIDLDLARLAFGFTFAEAQVTDLVCQGLTNAEIAERRDRSIETINAQVKTILGKSSVTNRTQLVRLLCNFSMVPMQAA